jgi:hypothetical protein
MLYKEKSIDVLIGSDNFPIVSPLAIIDTSSGPRQRSQHDIVMSDG